MPEKIQLTYFDNPVRYCEILEHLKATFLFVVQVKLRETPIPNCV